MMSPAFSAYRPAGQAAPASVAQAPAVTPLTTPSIGVGPDGRIAGIDGMLDQVAGALVRQATPLVQSQILPAIQRDRALQATVGAAAGRAAAHALRPWVILGTVSLATLAAVSVYHAMRPASRRSSRPTRSS